MQIKRKKNQAFVSGFKGEFLKKYKIFLGL